MPTSPGLTRRWPRAGSSSRPTRWPTGRPTCSPATSALAYLREVRATEAPEASRLAERVRRLASELVTTQNDDGGWPWIAPRTDQPRTNSDRMTSARVGLAIEAARSVGLLADPAVADKAVGYLNGEFLKAGGDLEGRAAVLHALARLRQGGFEQANALNRSRQSLNDVSLAYLALTFSAFNRPTMADEVLDLLASRAKREAVGPGKKPRIYWEASNQGPWHRGPVETTALACLAFASGPPAGRRGRGGRGMAPRPSPGGNGWNPETRPRGPAVAALAAFYGKAKEAAATATAWSSPSTGPRSAGSRCWARGRTGRSSSPASCSSPAWPTPSGSRSRGEGLMATR